MKKNRVKIGDKIRYVYPNYYVAMKSDYSQPSFWSTPEQDREDLMIGAEYTVSQIKTVRLFWKKYKVDEADLWIYQELCVPSTEDVKCPFKVGQEVSFKPKCSQKETVSLNRSSGLIVGRKYQIIKIINEFYVVLNSSIPNIPENFKHEDSLKQSVPLKWTDLSRE